VEPLKSIGTDVSAYVTMEEKATERSEADAHRMENDVNNFSAGLPMPKDTRSNMTQVSGENDNLKGSEMAMNVEQIDTRNGGF
jgi:hypothetical protein